MIISPGGYIHECEEKSMKYFMSVLVPGGMTSQAISFCVDLGFPYGGRN